MAQWMIKEETANRLVLEKGLFSWRKKIQIDLDVSSDIVSITTNQKGTTKLSFTGIEKIELYEDRNEWIVYIQRLEGTLFLPAKEYPEWMDTLHIYVCADFDRTKMSGIAEILARFLKKSVAVTSFSH
jgi:hypothetical protein